MTNNISTDNENWTRQQDKKYADVLQLFSDVFAQKFQSFDDFAKLETKQLIANTIQTSKILNNTDSIPRVYALNALLGDRKDLPFEYLENLYRNVTPDSPSNSGARSEIANRLIRALNPKDSHQIESYFRLFDEVNSADQCILLDGFMRIKDRKYNSLMLQSLRKALQFEGGLWFAADIARKKRFKILLPELLHALQLTSDKEILRAVQKAIDTLGKQNLATAHILSVSQMQQKILQLFENVEFKNATLIINDKKEVITVAAEMFELEIVINDKWVGYQFDLHSEALGISTGSFYDTDLYPLEYDWVITQEIFDAVFNFTKALLTNKIYYGLKDGKATLAYPDPHIENAYRVTLNPKRRFFVTIDVEHQSFAQVCKDPDLKALLVTTNTNLKKEQ